MMVFRLLALAAIVALAFSAAPASKGGYGAPTAMPRSLNARRKALAKGTAPG